MTSLSSTGSCRALCEAVASEAAQLLVTDLPRTCRALMSSEMIVGRRLGPIHIPPTAGLSVRNPSYPCQQTCSHGTGPGAVQARCSFVADFGFANHGGPDRAEITLCSSNIFPLYPGLGLQTESQMHDHPGLRWQHGPCLTFFVFFSASEHLSRMLLKSRSGAR